MLWWIPASFKGQLTIWHGFIGPKRTAGRVGRDFARESVVDFGLAVILNVDQVDETLGNFPGVLRLQASGHRIRGGGERKNGVARWRIRWEKFFFHDDEI
jgi:hypothetical protein